jgi:hypothetical protein
LRECIKKVPIQYLLMVKMRLRYALF